MIKTNVQLRIFAGSFLLFPGLLAVWIFWGYQQEYAALTGCYLEMQQEQVFEQQVESSRDASLECKEECKELQMAEEVDNPECDFFPVNRTSDHLREGAVSFARTHNLADPVFELYTGDVLTALERKKQPKKQATAKKKTVRKKISGADLSRWNKRSIDPRFDLPIDKNKFWLSSPFAPRKNPNGTMGFHYGIDMAAMRGTPIKAAGDGVVMKAGYQKVYGNVVVIQHDKKFKTRYAHFSKIRPELKIGKKVFAGQVIGYVGSTGNARASGKTRDASHLHFEVEVYGKRMNPFYFFKNKDFYDKENTGMV
jgi:murein DD-endopeptidase MepM/ murein hydrolase activator NlpD